MKPRIITTSALIGVFLYGASLLAAEQSSPSTAEKSVKHVDAKEAQKLVMEKKVVVIDVRTPKEFSEGHIAGATNIDFRAEDFGKRIGQLDKNKAYLVHCAAGGRSTQSLATFKKQEIRSIYHLDGGFNGWKKEGLPVEK
jgi:phage shock protein E